MAGDNYSYTREYESKLRGMTSDQKREYDRAYTKRVEQEYIDDEARDKAYDEKYAGFYEAQDLLILVERNTRHTSQIKFIATPIGIRAGNGKIKCFNKPQPRKEISLETLMTFEFLGKNVRRTNGSGFLDWWNNVENCTFF